MIEYLLVDSKVYKQYIWDLEEDFEEEVVMHSQELFGEESIYIDIKKRIGKGDILSIPDGYLVDFSFKAEPRLYIVENELSTHDPFSHIGEQMLRFAISYKASGRRIKEFLLKDIVNDTLKKSFVDNKLESLEIRNIDAFLESIIFDRPVKAIVVIDKSKIMSAMLSEKAKLLADLKSNKISIDQLGLDLLAKNLKTKDKEKVEMLFVFSF